MNKKAANLISIIFHPLLLTTYLLAGFVLVDPMIALPPGYNFVTRWLIVLIVFITTFIIPSLSILMLKFSGSIKSLRLEGQRERVVPFFYNTVLYGFTAYYFYSQRIVNNIADAFFLLIAINIFIAWIINYFWKISIHSLGMGGVVGLLVVISILMPESPVKYMMFCAIPVAGLVMMARLSLNAHTPAQVYSGFVLGLFVSFMLIFWI